MVHCACTHIHTSDPQYTHLYVLIVSFAHASNDCRTAIDIYLAISICTELGYMVSEDGTYILCKACTSAVYIAM